MKMKALVAQLCLTFCNTMDYSPPGSSVHGILLARILEWVAITFSRGSFWPWDQPWPPSLRQILFHLFHQRSPHLLCWYPAWNPVWSCLWLFPGPLEFPAWPVSPYCGSKLQTGFCIDPCRILANSCYLTSLFLRNLFIRLFISNSELVWNQNRS